VDVVVCGAVGADQSGRDIRRTVVSVFPFLAMLRGAIDTRELVFFVSLTAVLFVCYTRVLESRRWR
jgi:hypothetical protein